MVRLYGREPVCELMNLYIITLHLEIHLILEQDIKIIKRIRLLHQIKRNIIIIPAVHPNTNIRILIHMMRKTMTMQMILQKSGRKNLAMVITMMGMMMPMIIGKMPWINVA